MYKEAISSEHKPKPNEQKIMARLRTEIELFLSTMSSCLNSASLCSFFSLIRCKNFVANYLKQRAKFKSRTSLWEKIRGMFKEYLIDSWDDLLKAIAYGRKAPIKLVPNTG